MDYIISDIKDTKLQKEVLKLPKGRLRDYYRDFIYYHENVIKYFHIEDYMNMPMRNAVEALCKVLFHEIREDADDFYTNSGNDGNHIYLSGTTIKPSLNVFYFKGKRAGKKKKTDIKDEEILPLGLIQQIGAGLAEKLNYGKDDRRYLAFRNVHHSVQAYESNDKEHVCADADKAKYSLTGRISDYESFVHYVLTTFDQYLQIKLAGQISSAAKSDFNELNQVLATEQALKNEKVESLIQNLKELLETYYPDPMILIAPRMLSTPISLALTRIPWNLIITFDPEGEKDGHLIHAIRTNWNGLRPFKICADANNLTDGQDETGVIFANGDTPDNSFDKYPDWRNQYEDHVFKAISKVRRGSQRITAVVITDTEDSRIFNLGGIGKLGINDTVLIIGTIGLNLKDRLENEFGIKYENYDISTTRTVFAFNQLPQLINCRETAHKVGLTAEDIARYAANGIRIISLLPSNTEIEANPVTDFYIGTDITEKDLYNEFDVKRRFYEDLKNIVKSRLVAGSRFTHYLHQTPSCGATTVAMRLAYDIASESASGKLGVDVVSLFISEIKTQSINPMVDRIKDMALKLSASTHILAIIDRSIQGSDFDRLKETLIESSSLRISFVRISDKERGATDYNTEISDELSELEKVKFIAKYQRYADVNSLDKKDINDSLRYVIDFPLSLNRDERHQININEYVKTTLCSFRGSNMLTIRKLVALISFCSEYIVNTDNYVEGFLFNGILGKQFLEWYQYDLDRKERKAFERIILFEEKEKKRSGKIKTRFSKFNPEILKLSEWSITDIAREYIRIFFSDPKVSADPKLINDYIIDLFFKKDGYEDEDSTNYYGKSEKQKFYKKLSPVFNKINDPDSLSIIFDDLQKYIGDYPRYLISKAQYIYNRAYFIDSAEHDAKVFKEARNILEGVLDNNTFDLENESVVLQSLGVLNYRRLGALRKVEVKNQKTIDLAKKYVSDVVKYCDMAFEKNPYDTHSLVTKAQALKSFLNMAKDVVQPEKNSYGFSESEQYLEITEQYEETYENLAGFIRNLDLDNLTMSQSELISIFETLKLFYYRLIGLKEDEIFDNYKLKINSTATGNERRKLYVNRLFNVLVDAPISQIRMGKISCLSDDKLRYIEEQLSKSIRLGNLSGYEKIFRLHLFNGRRNCKISDELQWLKNWISKDSNVQSQLWGQFYLATLYFSEVLKEGHDFNGYLASAKKYRDGAKEIAKLLSRNDTEDHFYYKEGKGLQSITETASNASLMEGKIIEIKNNRQGIALLDCGLEATFAPKGKFLMEDADKHTRIRAKVGFRFSGLGLYGAERIEQARHSDDVNESFDPIKEDVSNGKKDGPSVSGQMHHINNSPAATVSAIISTTTYDGKYELEEDYDFFGVYHSDKYRKYITGNWKESWIKYLSIEGDVDSELYDGADVCFAVKKVVDEDNGDEKWIAYDIRFKE